MTPLTRASKYGWMRYHMAEARCGYIDERKLNALIIQKYRSGQTVKTIIRDLKHYTIEHEGGALPPGYVEKVLYSHVMECGL